MHYFLCSAILFQKNVKVEDTQFVVAIDVGSAFSSYAYAVKVCYKSKQPHTLIRWYVLSRKLLRTTPCLTITYHYNFNSFEIRMPRLVGYKVKTVNVCGANEAERHLEITLSIVCPSVCLSVCPSVCHTFGLRITFLPSSWEIGLSYLPCVFLMTGP